MSRNDIFLRMVDALQNGHSLELIGEHGSGRTFLLNRVTEHFVSLGWNPIEIRGIESLRQAQLAALLIAGQLESVDPRSMAVSSAFNALQERANKHRSIFIVDDCDALDTMSWGVIDAVSLKNGIPVVAARLRHRPMHIPVNLTGGYRPMYSVEMKPMGYRELEKALGASRDFKIESTTMSRLFAKSGGNVGLAIAIVDAAYRSGALKNVNGELVAGGSLWTPELRTLSEIILQPLEPEDLLTMKTLSIMGPTELETVKKIVPEEQILKLENRAYLAVVHAEGHHIVTIRLPLIVEYFNYDATLAQRAAIIKKINEALYAPHLGPNAQHELRDAAVDTQLIHESSKLLLLKSREAWHANATIANAIGMLQALEQDPFHDFEEIDALHAAAQRVPATPAEHAEWVVAFSSHITQHRNQLSEALELLERSTLDYPAEKATFLAQAFILQVASGDCPATDPLHDVAVEDLLDRSRTVPLVAKLYWLVIRGHVTEAEELLLRFSEQGREDPRLNWVMVYCNIAQGKIGVASRVSREMLAEAQLRFDGPLIRMYAYLDAVTSLLERQPETAEKSLAVALSIGLPQGEASLSQLGINILNGYFAASRGQRLVVTELLARLDSLNVADGPLPGLQRAYIYSKVAMIEGRTKDASQIHFETANQLWSRGALLAAAYHHFDGMIADPTVEAWKEYGPRMRQVEAKGVQHLADFVEALASRNIEQIIKKLEVYATEGRSRALHHGLKAIAVMETEAFLNEAESARLRAAIEASNFPLPAVDVALSAREREVAMLIATGLSNPLIADALALSVRTVESHINRLMKKINVQRREEIREHFLALGNTD